ncbi:MAG: CBS domain-containing protein [Ignavibacteriales bacterium]|nr:MAG: CBS domain-containing protein [Ignavibacteriales bacterium]
MAKTVAAILKSKGYNIHSVSPDATVFEALKIMADHKIGALLVLEGEKLAGILSERDYARKVILLGKSSREAKVKEIMSDKVWYVQPYRTAEECMALMINKRIRHLPVIDQEKLAGVISIGDVVKAVIDEKEFVIEQLEEYISGRKITAEA